MSACRMVPPLSAVATARTCPCSRYCSCAACGQLLGVAARTDNSCCLALAGAMMVGDTLFRSSDGKSHCPICKGKVRSSRVSCFA